MKAIAKALEDQGPVFPFPWKLPVNLHEGYLVSLLAAPRVGKSLVAVNWAVEAAKQGYPVLMHTVDTSYEDQATRTICLLSGETSSSIDANKDYWSGWLAGVDLPIRWSQSDLHDGNFNELVEAEREYWGEYPKFIVVDVVMNLLRGEEGLGSVQRIFRSLQQIGRRTGAVVLALHHVVSGDAAGGSLFVRMEDGMYEKGRIPEIVLTMWRSGTDQLTMHLAKNRQGPDGASVQLNCDYSRARVWSR
jgi:hypothetical protein